MLQYSLYGHIKALAEAEKEGVEKVLGADTVKIYQYVEATSTYLL